MDSILLCRADVRDDYDTLIATLQAIMGPKDRVPVPTLTPLGRKNVKIGMVTVLEMDECYGVALLIEKRAWPHWRNTAELVFRAWAAKNGAFVELPRENRKNAIKSAKDLKVA